MLHLLPLFFILFTVSSHANNAYLRASHTAANLPLSQVSQQHQEARDRINARLNRGNKRSVLTLQADATPTTSNRKREAVLILSHDIPTPCSFAGRMLYHLASTAGTHRDIWLLVTATDVPYGRMRLTPPDNTTNLYRRPDLFINLDSQAKYAPTQRNNAWDNFSPIKGRSKGAKNMMVMWMAEHVHDYNFVWHVETDILFTGAAWSDIFNELNEDTADVVSSVTTLNAITNWYWVQQDRCHIDNNKNCAVKEAEKHTFNFVQANLAIVRISTRFAVYLRHALDSESVIGHHEAVIYPICKATPWCVWVPKIPYMTSKFLQITKETNCIFMLNIYKETSSMLSCYSSFPNLTLSLFVVFTVSQVEFFLRAGGI